MHLSPIVTAKVFPCSIRTLPATRRLPGQLIVVLVHARPSTEDRPLTPTATDPATDPGARRCEIIAVRKASSLQPTASLDHMPTNNERMNQDLDNPMERPQLPAAANGLQSQVSAPTLNEFDQELGEWALPYGQPPFGTDNLFASNENSAADNESFLADTQSFLGNGFPTQVEPTMAGHINNTNLCDVDPAEIINTQVSRVNGSQINPPVRAPQPMTVGQYARNEASIVAKHYESITALASMVENLERAHSQEQRKVAQLNKTIKLLESALESRGVDVQAVLSQQENKNFRPVNTQELPELTSDATKGRADSVLPVSPRNSVFTHSDAEDGNADSVPIFQSNSASAESTDRIVNGTALPRAGIDAIPNHIESASLPTSRKRKSVDVPGVGDNSPLIQDQEGPVAVSKRSKIITAPNATSAPTSTEQSSTPVGTKTKPTRKAPKKTTADNDAGKMVKFGVRRYNATAQIVDPQETAVTLPLSIITGKRALQTQLLSAINEPQASSKTTVLLVQNNTTTATAANGSSYRELRITELRETLRSHAFSPDQEAEASVSLKGISCFWDDLTTLESRVSAANFTL